MKLTSEQIERAMTLAQEFASSWSCVGGQFDTGDQIDLAEEAKDELRSYLKSIEVHLAHDAQTIAALQADLRGIGIEPAPLDPLFKSIEG